MSNTARFNRKGALRQSLVATTTLVCIGLACGASVSASELHPVMSQAMQRDLGLTLRQITALRNVEKAAASEEILAKRTLGSNFAGSWIERQADGSYRQVVAASGPVKPGARRAGVELRKVRHSLAALERSKESLDRSVRSQIVGISKPLDAGIHSWHVDPQTNTVVVALAPGADEAGIDFVAASGADIETVRFETSEGTPQLLAQNVAGGNPYAFQRPDGKTGGCSVGFSVTQGPHIGFATAAHCGAPNRYVAHGGEWIGHFSQITNAYDSAWVAVFPGHNMMPYVNDYFAFNRLLEIRGSVEAGIGSAVCRSGYKTGFQCGHIRAKNVSLNVTNFGVVQGLTQASTCAGQGDSGGSWLIGDQAQGVTSSGEIPVGKTDNCGVPEATRKTYFAPINPLLQRYGLTLTVTQ
ncbi:S1 family peptidase [Lysobacter sp. cf310]|uniref:S1 family peptidase n=1 Tax=Lysobacter sp. cf310 TaxID=1761790 RepID=UPI0008E44144|nr:S1 family peptidase [Lysobacter sp. cf310]SFK69104.1 streptogrisin C [Lysobacter sp. cf310]